MNAFYFCNLLEKSKMARLSLWVWAAIPTKSGRLSSEIDALVTVKIKTSDRKECENFIDVVSCLFVSIHLKQINGILQIPKYPKSNTNRVDQETKKRTHPMNDFIM